MFATINVTAAIIDAGRWIDASISNRQKTAEVVADKSYVNADKDVITARMLGRYDNGIGKVWDDKDYMKFYNDGYVTFPFLSDGMWFMTQHRRWGLLKEDPDYLAVAQKVNRIDIYKEAAAAFEKAAKRVKNSDGKSGRVKFKAETDYFPFRMKERLPVVKRAVAAVSGIGATPTIRAANGGLDANWMVRHGVPTVTFGAGQNEPHTIDEWINLDEYDRACALAVQLATMR